METVKSNLRIQHDLIGKLFYIKVRSGNAEMHYERHGDKYLDLISVLVPRDSRGFGIGSALVESAIAFAREQHLKIKLTCSFAKSYFEEHPQYEYLLV